MKKNYDVIIFCGGKCGSTSLEVSLINNGYDVIKIHSFMHSKKVHKNDDLYNVKNIKDFFDIQINDVIYIIDSYRTPIERHICAFFQNLIFHIKKPFNEFNEELPIFKDDKFDFDKKYILKELIVNNNKQLYIKLRFKEINDWDKILSQIFNKDIKMSSENLSENKPYKNTYKLFKKYYKVPEEYLDAIKNRPIFNKYNSTDEINEYINFWNNNLYDNNLSNHLENNYDKFFENTPSDFNVEVYKSINTDLVYKNNIDYQIHWELIGFYENRKYK